MADPIPQGHEGFIPYLVVKGAPEAIEFYKKAFGAEEISRMPTPDGRIGHAELTIGGDVLYLSEDMPEMCGGKSRTPQALGGTPVSIHRYVQDVDAAVDKARKAGATVDMGPDDMFWGDRFASMTDPFGHKWSLATHISDPTPEEMQAAMAAMCKE